jgi:hypothetical protein
MQIYYELSLFFILGFIEFIIDLLLYKKLYTNCNHLFSFYVELLFHHIIGFFTTFGWLSSNKYMLILYVFTTLSVIIQWNIMRILGKGKCIITNNTNRICKLKKYEKLKTWSVMLKIDKYKSVSIIKYIYMIFGILFAIKKIKDMH